MTEQESSLLAGLQTGNPASFENLVRTYSNRLLATAARILGSESDAQDVVQETLISAWRGIAGFEGTSSLYTWLHRITVNACLARLRTARAKSEVSIADDNRSVGAAFEGLPTAWSEPGPSTEKRLTMRRALEKALRIIPEEFRAVLLLRDVEDLSSREVADQLGLPDATVRQRLHRARTLMAELLRPELCDGPELICGGQLDLLMDYIDNELPAELQAPVHDHIEGCPACYSLRDTYRMTIGVPRAIAELTAADDVPSDWIAETTRMAGARRAIASA
jgi:RNA polymerase sigma-70 factor (ECF subfamily)